MTKMTVAQMREKELERLVGYRTSEPTEADYREARRLMNSFYRLCGLCETNLYLSNNERTCNTRYCAESEAREERWYKRLSKEFNDFAGLTLYYSGYMPSIGTRSPSGGCSEKVSRYFYE